MSHLEQMITCQDDNGFRYVVRVSREHRYGAPGVSEAILDEPSRRPLEALENGTFQIVGEDTILRPVIES